MLWETAHAKMRGVMEELFSSLHNAEHMLDVKNETSLLCAALRRYGFQVCALSRHPDTVLLAGTPFQNGVALQRGLQCTAVRALCWVRLALMCGRYLVPLPGRGQPEAA